MGRISYRWGRDPFSVANFLYNLFCVIMYSTGNEVSETAQLKGIELAGQMTCGINIFFNFLSSIGLGVYSDDKAERAAASAGKPKKDPKKKAVGSEFYNMLAVKVGDKFMKFGATLPPCDWKTRGAYANMDIAGYNYGLWRYKHDLKKYPQRLILGSANAYSDSNYAQDSTHTYYGEAMAIVRAGGTGPVKVMVSDETRWQTVEILCME